MKREEQKHESFGQIYFGRTNGHAEFYGSELEQSHYISMEIHQSEVHRELSKDWYFTKGLPVIRLRMTSGQFAELITSLNNGSGVPCTLEMVKGEKVAPLPKQESRKEFVHRKFEDRMKEFGDTIREKQQKAKELVKKKTLSKQDIHDLTHHIEWLTTEVERNIPFFAKCFQETMDEVVFEAKTEIENAIQHKINVLGLTALHDQNKLLQ
jgi:flagellar hook-basal body complex protein FliE